MPILKLNTECRQAAAMINSSSPIASSYSTRIVAPGLRRDFPESEADSDFEEGQPAKLLTNLVSALNYLHYCSSPLRMGNVRQTPKPLKAHRSGLKKRIHRVFRRLSRTLIKNVKLIVFNNCLSNTLNSIKFNAFSE